MWKYVLKRILMIIPILFGVAFIVYFIMDLTPSDPGRLILGLSASQQAVDAMNEQLGWNRPFFERFFEYIGNVVLHFDFGTSWFTGKSVVKEIVTVFPTTFKLALFTTILQSAIGIALGVFSAVRQYSPADNILRVVAMVLSAIPKFWFAMVGILVFSLYLGWLPSNGIDTWQSWIMPVVLMSICSSAPMLRLTRTIVLETIRQDYVRTVRAKGAPERQVIWQHVFKNSSLPLINTVGIGFGEALGGMVIIETIYSMPGIGNLSLTALGQKDMPLVMGCTLFLAAIYALMVLAVDVISAYADPRVKAKYVG